MVVRPPLPQPPPHHNKNDKGDKGDKSDGSAPKTVQWMDDRSRLLLSSLGAFYAKRNNIERIIPIINCQSPISLRLIDWTVTNYAYRYDVVLMRRAANNNIVHFHIWESYKSQLNAYSKNQFDPFRRRDRIEYYYEPDKCIETTLGQLNFFRWVLQNDILDFISDNLRDIEQDMLETKIRAGKRSGSNGRPSSSSPSSSSSTGGGSAAKEKERERGKERGSTQTQTPSSSVSASVSPRREGSSRRKSRLASDPACKRNNTRQTHRSNQSNPSNPSNQSNRTKQTTPSSPRRPHKKEEKEKLSANVSQKKEKTSPFTHTKNKSKSKAHAASTPFVSHYSGTNRITFE